MPVIRLSTPSDPEALAGAWRDLEQRAAGSFFQGWSWTGCLARERFPDPVLLEAVEEGQVVGLALFNRRGSGLEDTLHLGASGSAMYDAIFVEHNGVLTDARWDDTLAAAMLTTAMRSGSRWRRTAALSLPGVGEATLRAARQAGGIVRTRQARAAPWIDLAGLGSGAEEYLLQLSANTRYQIRRSERSYSARGTLRVERAKSPREAHAFLDALATLHQKYWEHRGQPGSFANVHFGRFHHGLIDHAFSRGEIDLLRIAAGEAVVGYLYNFRYRGRVLAYQSGFAYDGADRHEKPGLTCHHLAIEAYRAEGLTAYDFLGGSDRYKTSFATAEASLLWLSLYPPWSCSGALARVRSAVVAAARHRKHS